MQEHGYIEQR